MPLLTPGRRWQPPYLPFQRKSLGQRMLQGLEFLVKDPLFGYRMCGNCLLQETAFNCPMECPKCERNGPCGSSPPFFSYVDDSRPCKRYQIYNRAYRLDRQEKLFEVLPPLDTDKVGGETWGEVGRQVRKLGTRKVITGQSSRDLGLRASTWDSVFRPVRQPIWWIRDRAYHPPSYQEPVSELERSLRSGKSVVTAEVSPPVSAKTDKLIKNIQAMQPYVTTINFTDHPSATPRTTSWARSAIAVREGAEPVMQIAARDRTRVSLQSEALGAFDLGIRNILCISSDYMKMAPAQRGRMDIIDLDTIQMLWILRGMRDEARFMDEREVKTPPRYFLGAAASPFASEPRFQALREHKKVNAGAQFFQTNLVYDVAHLEIRLNELAKRGVLDKVFILIGITPLKTLKITRYMRNEVPGVQIPDVVLHRMEAAEEAGNPQEEGIQIALELIERIRKLEGQGVHGVHIMAVGWEEIVPRIVTEGGLLPRSFALTLFEGLVAKSDAPAWEPGN